jgi:nitrite reductase/ring-hydroxylating ferredoxin subunit
MELFDIAGTAELPLGHVRACSVNGRTIALYHTQKGFFATDNTCPHRGGPLAEGDLIGNEITCPWHLWGFDVETGLCAGNPDIRVAAHPVRVEGERILVKLP